MNPAEDERAGHRERVVLSRNRDFFKLWSGQTISALGTDLGALEFTALLFLNASPFQMGALAACAGAPVILLGPLIGVWLDRLTRRPLLIAADLGRAAILATVPVVALLGGLEIAQLYVVAALTAALALVFNLTYRSYLPSLVERDQLVEANSKLSLTESLAEIGGYAAGGGIVQITSGPFAVAVDAISFLASAFSIRSIRAKEMTPAPVGASARSDLGAGLRAIRRNPILRALILSSAVLTFFGGFLSALYALYLIRTLGFSPVVMGLTIAAGGAGSVAGSAVAPALGRRIGLGAIMLASRCIHIGTTFLIPLAGGPAEVALAMILAAQIAGDPFWTIYDINALSLRQTETPDRLLGRVNAWFHIVSAGLLPIGALTGGLLASQIGVRPTLLAAACGMIASAIPIAVSPIVRLKEMPRALPDNE